jgi:hypothetical protein
MTVDTLGQMVGSAEVHRMISTPNELTQDGNEVGGNVDCPDG